MSIAKAVVQRPVLWLVVFALITICGLYLLPNVGVDMYPEIESPYLIISTIYPGADPETVEKSLTNVLEAGLANTGGINEMTSVSREQVSIITMAFDFGSDMNTKISRVRENIDLVRSNLPDKAHSPVVKLLKSNDHPIMSIAVRGKNGRTQNELRALAKKEIQDRLKQLEGVASCDVVGGQDALVMVALSQNRLEAYGLTISEIARSLAAQNMELGAGSIEDGLVEYTIKTSGEYETLADIANTVVAQLGGADIRLQDIGEVSMGFQEERSAVYINGEPGVYLDIMKQSGSNIVDVADRIYRRIDVLQKTLPEDIRLEVIMDATMQIRSMIGELVNSAVSGVILAVLVLFLFLRNINGSIIVGLSIPISFLITLLVMSLAHITINMMTLAGLILGLGMVVDSSIVVMESITSFREKGEKPTVAAVLAGEEVMPSIIASTITTICVFLPIVLFKNQLERIGLLVKDLIFTMGIAVSSSLLVAIFLVPVLASKWLPVHSRIQKPLRNPVLAKIDGAIAFALNAVNKAYQRLLAISLKRRLATVLLVIAVFAGSIIILTKMDVIMMPDMNSDTVILNIELPLGTRYEETKAAALEIQEYAITEIKGIKNITASAGSVGSALTGKGNNTASITVNLNLDDPQADSNESVKEKFRSHFSLFPSAVFSFSSGLNLSTALNSGSTIDIVLRADDMQKGFADAAAIKTILKEQVPEVHDIVIDVNPGLPQVNINIDRQRAYNMGLTIASIAGEIAASMNGVTATTFRQNGTEYDVVLQLAKEDRYELPDLGRIFVRSSKGVMFPVSNFAAFEKTAGPVSINHEEQGRTIHVRAGLQKGQRAGDAERKIKTLLDEQGISANFAGSLQNTQKMLRTFVLVMTLALLLVFGVMAAQYESFTDPFINFCTIPLILIGVVGIHLVTGQALNALTMIGFVMLAGIVVNNGILLVDYTNILIRRGMPLEEACLEAGRVRFRPVLMTALTTMLGLAPMAFFPGKSSELVAPIGLAIFGGMTSATFITLFFIPVLYALFHGKKREKPNEA